MSRTIIRTHTPWKPKTGDKPIIKRTREHPRHTIKRRLRLSITLREATALDDII